MIVILTFCVCYFLKAHVAFNKRVVYLCINVMCYDNFIDCPWRGLLLTLKQR